MPEVWYVGEGIREGVMKIIRDDNCYFDQVDDVELCEEYGRQAGYYVFQNGLVGHYGQCIDKPPKGHYFLLMLVLVGHGAVYRRDIEILTPVDDAICQGCAKQFIEDILG